jgi:hypothetical protein
MYIPVLDGYIDANLVIQYWYEYLYWRTYQVGYSDLRQYQPYTGTSLIGDLRLYQVYIPALHQYKNTQS